MVEWGLVSLLYLALAVLLTWPIAIRMGSSIYGFGNDNWGGIWVYHWLHEAFWGPGKASFSPELQAPFGLAVGQNTIQPIDRFFAIVFGGLSDGLVAYNLQIFLSFVLAGLSMYAFARWLTGSRLGAALAGVIVTASPFHLAYAMQYPAHATIELVPLFVWALVLALQTKRAKHAALAGLAFAGVWYSSYYYGWMGVWFALAVLVAAGIRALFNGARARRIASTMRDGAAFLVKRGSVAAVAFLVLAVPALLALTVQVSSNGGAFQRTLADLYQGSVRPWQFVLPPHDSPVFGGLTRTFIETHLGSLPNYEQAVYLGFIPVVLTIVAIVLRRRMLGSARYAWPLLVVGGLFCILLALGPYIPVNVFSVNAWVNTASVSHINNFPYYLFKISASFRYYGRAFVFTSVCLAALAAIGFAVLEPRLRRLGRIAPLLAAGLLAALVLVEFENRPSADPTWLDTTPKPWVKAVAALPKGASIVDYPIRGLNSPRGLYYEFWQTKHHHPTQNPVVTPQAAKLTLAIEDPNQVGAGAALHRSGLRYVVIHTQLPPPADPVYQGNLPPDSLSAATASQNPWLQRVKAVPDAVIYKVLPAPRPLQAPLAQYGIGFGGPEVENKVIFHWLTSPSGTFTVVSPDKRRAVLSFYATSIAGPRRVSFYSDGRRFAARTVQGQPIYQTVKVPVRLHKGTNVVKIKVTPGPVVADSVLHDGDPRPLAIRVETPQILPG